MDMHFYASILIVVAVVATCEAQSNHTLLYRLFSLLSSKPEMTVTAQPCFQCCLVVACGTAS